MTPKTRKNRPQKLIIIGQKKISCTGPAAQMAQKQISHSTKSPLMQDWGFRLGIACNNVPGHFKRLIFKLAWYIFFNCFCWLRFGHIYIHEYWVCMYVYLYLFIHDVCNLGNLWPYQAACKNLLKVKSNRNFILKEKKKVGKD